MRRLFRDSARRVKVVLGAILGFALTVEGASSDSAISAALAPYQEATNVPGIVSVVWNNRTQKLYVDTCGYANVAAKKPISENDVFWIASMTKGFTAAMILQLVDKGVLGLDDKVVDWIPAWKDIKVWKNFGKEEDGLKDDPNTQLITIRHLLCHRAGLGDVQYPINSWTCKAQTEYYIQHGCRYAPNTVFGYTNGGLEVAAYICEIATGKSYPELMKEYVFDPLGLEHTTFAPTIPKADMPHVYHINAPYGENFCKDQGGHSQIKYDPATGLVKTTGYAAGGGLFSTVADLVKFYRFVGNRGVTVEGKRLISEATFKEWTLESDYWKTHKREYTTNKPHGNYSLGMYVSDKVPCQIGHEGFCCTYGYSLWDSGSCRIYLVQLYTKQYNETYNARKAALEAAVDRVLSDEGGGGDDPPSAHVHDWREGTRIEPTCTTDGSVVSNCTGTGTCDMGGAKTAFLLKLGHDWSAWNVTRPPQVGVKGVETRTCRRSGCGAVETRDVDPLPPPEPPPEPGARVPTDYGYRLTVVAGGVTNVVCVFTNVTKSWNWCVPDGVTKFDCLVVGGGGGGGGNYGGGGGAGGLVSSAGVACASGGVFAVSVGAGGKGGANSATGTGVGAKGTASSLALVSTGFRVEALGGGGGGSLRGAGSDGGSGGGAGGSCSGVATNCRGGSGASGQGHDGGTVPGKGYSGCGGGGACGVGRVPRTKDEAGEYYGGIGGEGFTSSIAGEFATYAEGGTGGGRNESGPAGLDGRGAGGGGGKAGAAGARGGNGIVVVRYAVAGADPRPHAVWTEPEDDSLEAIRKALADDGFDEAVQLALATRSDYEAFKGYCVSTLGIDDPKAGAKAGVKANALLGYALGATTVPETPIASKDVTIASVKRQSDEGSVVVDVKVMGFESKDASAVGTVLQKVVDAIGGTSLEAMSRENVSVAGKVADGRLVVTVSPKGPFSQNASFFVRVVIRI